MSSNMDIEMLDYTTENTQLEEEYYEGDEFDDYDTSTCGNFKNTLYHMLYELTEQNLHHLIDKPCVYLIALFINDKWVLKIGRTQNLSARFVSLNNPKWSLYLDKYFNPSYLVPKILPLALFFTNDILTWSNMETSIKKIMLENNLLMKDTDKFGSKSEEITADINSELYDLVLAEFRSKDNVGYTWESEMYVVNDDNIIGYKFDENEEPFWLN